MYNIRGNIIKSMMIHSIEENSILIQRIFVHAFASCVRHNAKIELDYLIKNHALIYFKSCRTKPSDIRHNILTYCVVRNLPTVLDQLMTNMKTTMYKTYENSTNLDWQPHIAWREITHIIIDPVAPQKNDANESNDFTQLTCYGDTTTNFSAIGSILILHAADDEYRRCIQARNNITSKAKRKLSGALKDGDRHQLILHRMVSLDQQQIENVINHVANDNNEENHNFEITSNTTVKTASGTSLMEKAKKYS